MDRDNALRTIINTNDATTQFAILKINETTFKMLGAVKKYGTPDQFRLLKEGVADVIQDAFNKVKDITSLDTDKIPSLSRHIQEEANNLIRPIAEQVMPKYSSNAEAYGWNKFITDSMMDKIRLSKGIPISEWEGKFTIRKNSSYEIKNVYEGDLETFLNTIMNKDVYYYSTDEWLVVINKVPHTEDSVTDMVNYLLTCFADGERDIVFNAWQDWMFTHRKELEEKK